MTKRLPKGANNTKFWTRTIVGKLVAMVIVLGVVLEDCVVDKAISGKMEDVMERWAERQIIYVLPDLVLPYRKLPHLASSVTKPESITQRICPKKLKKSQDSVRNPFELKICIYQ